MSHFRMDTDEAARVVPGSSEPIAWIHVALESSKPFRETLLDKLMPPPKKRHLATASVRLCWILERMINIQSEDPPHDPTPGPAPVPVSALIERARTFGKNTKQTEIEAWLTHLIDRIRRATHPWFRVEEMSSNVGDQPDQGLKINGRSGAEVVVTGTWYGYKLPVPMTLRLRFDDSGGQDLTWCELSEEATT